MERRIPLVNAEKVNVSSKRVGTRACRREIAGDIYVCQSPHIAMGAI